MSASDSLLPFLTFPALSVAQLQALARRLAKAMAQGDCIALAGEVGAGKTTFARALIGAIAVGMPEITSPTFTLMQSYDVTLANSSAALLWHLDLYRLKEANEAHALGLEEIWPHVVLVEWPERIEGMLPTGYLSIVLDFTHSGAARSVHFYGNDAWRKRLETLGLQA